VLADAHARRGGRDFSEIAADLAARVRLEVERVQVAHPAPREQHDARPGLAPAPGPRRRRSIAQRQHARQRKPDRPQPQRITPRRPAIISPGASTSKLVPSERWTRTGLKGRSSKRSSRASARMFYPVSDCSRLKDIHIAPNETSGRGKVRSLNTLKMLALTR